MIGKADVLGEARETLERYGHESTDGIWLERLTEKVALHLADWDVDEIHSWADWPSRLELFPRSTAQDPGIDLVARRGSDGRYIAIQCKARKLDSDGTGGEISKSEISKFAHPAGSDVFAEQWLVTNGASSPSSRARHAIEISDKPVKVVNLTAEVTAADAAAPDEAGDCPHCHDPEAEQTRSCMQREAVAASVRILREHAEADSGGLPRGQARGRIILPCGTGKTRIALRIVEELTGGGVRASFRWCCVPPSRWCRSCDASFSSTPAPRSGRWRFAPTRPPVTIPKKRATTIGPSTPHRTTAT